jgi:hypothetical protein
MDTDFVIVTCTPSAFKHGLTRENILCAMRECVYDSIFEGDPERFLLIGFDNNGNLLEILYNVIDEYSVRVFHAMKCRNTTLSVITY